MEEFTLKWSDWEESSQEYESLDDVISEISSHRDCWITAWITVYDESWDEVYSN